MARRPQRTVSFLTQDELRRLLDAARVHGLRSYCMVLLGYRHGLRASEVCRLRLDDLDVAGGHILCRRAKGSLTNWQSMAADEKGAAGAWIALRGPNGTPWLFPGRPEDKPISRQHFHGTMQALGRLAGLPRAKCHPHALKHSIGTHLANAGVPVQVIQQRLGHRSINNTMVYLTIASQYVDRAVASAIEAGAVL